MLFNGFFYAENHQFVANAGSKSSRHLSIRRSKCEGVSSAFALDVNRVGGRPVPFLELSWLQPITGICFWKDNLSHSSLTLLRFKIVLDCYEM